MNAFDLSIIICVVHVTLITAISLVGYTLFQWLSRSSRAPVVLASLLMVGGISIAAFMPYPSWFDLAAPRMEGLEPALTQESSVEVASRTKSAPSTNSDATPSRRDPSSRPIERERLSASELASLFADAMVRNSRESASQSKDNLFSFATIIVIGLLLSAFIGITRFGYGLWSVRHLRRLSQPLHDETLVKSVEIYRARMGCVRGVEVRESSRLTTAAAVGWKRPILYLPAQWREWTQDELHVVLAHELAHIKRNDFVRWLVAQIGVAIHFYHPLVHRLATLMSTDQEIAADQLAATAIGNRKKYLTILARLAVQSPTCHAAWPAQMFLPRRKSFLRRIEMLRDSGSRANDCSSVTRAILVGMTLAIGLSICGLRNPGEDRISAAPVNASTVSLQQSSLSKSKLSYIPKDAIAVTTIRPSHLVSLDLVEKAHEEFLSKQGEGLDMMDMIEESLGIPLRDIDQISLVAVPNDPTADAARLRTGAGQPLQTSQPVIIGAVVHLTKALSAEDSEIAGRLRELPVDGMKKTYQVTGEHAFRFAHQVDKKIWLVSDRLESLLRLSRDGKASRTPLPWSSDWDRVAKSAIASFVDLNAMSTLASQPTSPNTDPMAGLFKPLLEDGKYLFFGTSLNRELEASAFCVCDTTQEATQIAKVAEALIQLARASFATYQAEAELFALDTPQAHLQATYGEIAGEVLDNLKVVRKKNVVEVKTEVKVDIDLYAELLAQAAHAARESARQAQSMNNMKQFGLAMHNYHDTFGSLPPSVVIGPDGKTPHSWRIELLPFIEEQEMYDRYRMDEPWDSPHNLEVTSRMPDAFRHPSDDSNSTNTAYLLLTGEGTAFTDDGAMEFRDIRDGLSNTIMMVEAKTNTHWAQPLDMPYIGADTLSLLGGFNDDDTITATLFDGSVHRLPASIDSEVFEAMVSPNGQEVVEPNR